MKIFTCFASTLVNGLPPCQPKDHLHLHVPYDLENLNQKKDPGSSYGFDYTQCIYDCR